MLSAVAETGSTRCVCVCVRIAANKCGQFVVMSWRSAPCPHHVTLHGGNTTTRTATTAACAQKTDAYSKYHSNHENFISNYVQNSSVAATAATAIVCIESNDVTPLNVLRLRDNGEM